MPWLMMSIFSRSYVYDTANTLNWISAFLQSIEHIEVIFYLLGSWLVSPLQHNLIKTIILQFTLTPFVKISALGWNSSRVGIFNLPAG